MMAPGNIIGTLPLPMMLPLVLAGCLLPFSATGGGEVIIEEGTIVQDEPGGHRFPDVLEVRLDPLGDCAYGVHVTLSSPYDTPERYAAG